MVKVQKIAPYNFEFRKISGLSSQTECYFIVVLLDFFLKGFEVCLKSISNFF